MKKIAQGAEAKLFLDGKNVIKDRFKKTYRIKEIDDRLRGFRTRREAKIFNRLKDINFPAPRLIESYDKERLVMDFIDGTKVRDILEKSDYKRLCKEIGKKIAVLHNNGIIHGDLTTSNMLFKDEVYFIDFGLSFFSDKIEDKAVDIHLLKQALESKHYTIWEKCFESALVGYKKEAKDISLILDRFDRVEKRGRYKGKRKNI
ncbi:MAG: Kae1-associated serine/threonine protein kinase [Nanoarchaeota archaeon]|nr:Kae1-associated serine/threonine protein kinase [Nanoarchaeota archaeon]MBU1004776.1 Kae1-associated serine/threonine protein kinase [Nanoarchaeota archaeon]MBU1946453.1 Kae1-associated serine/threonine protein kinase [Nanoarchaeota archaeon]